MLSFLDFIKKYFFYINNIKLDNFLLNNTENLSFIITNKFLQLFFYGNISDKSTKINFLYLKKKIKQILIKNNIPFTYNNYNTIYQQTSIKTDNIFDKRSFIYQIQDEIKNKTNMSLGKTSWIILTLDSFLKLIVCFKNNIMNEVELEKMFYAYTKYCLYKPIKKQKLTEYNIQTVLNNEFNQRLN